MVRCNHAYWWFVVYCWLDNIIFKNSKLKIILGNSLTESEICASDLNLDETIDILDIVTLVNIIMSEN